MNSSKDSSVGLRLREFREQTKKTQTEFALILGTDQRKIAYYEKEGRNLPPLKILAELSSLGLNLHWLATGEGSKFKFDSSDEEIKAARARIDPTSVSPKFIEEAYKLLYEAVRVAGADLMAIDPSRAAAVLRIAARELARSGTEEVRRNLIREAELILGLVKGSE